MVNLTRAQWLGLAALTLMWGVNWPMMKFSLRELSPLYFRATTMSAGALLLYAWFRWRGTSMHIPRAHWAALVLLALPNIFGWHLLSILGVQALASGRAAILGFTMPIWTVLLGALFYGQGMTRRTWISVAAGVLAVGLLIGQEIGSIAGRPAGVLWMQGAALSWALGTLWMRRTTLPLPTEAITVWMMLLSAAAFWIVAPIVEPWPSWQFSVPMWGALLWGATVNYGIAQVIWFGMARDLAPQASTFAIMAVPLIGVLSATLIVGEIPRWTDGLAALFVMAAIASALWPQPAK
ncbi:MAG: DMT family transporter [Rubrivivax sp.]|jgi:drug/metabolite transporter (DMT)-like permease|nr:DMT family transporter [Rubrivivax sp.]